MENWVGLQIDRPACKRNCAPLATRRAFNQSKREMPLWIHKSNFGRPARSFNVSAALKELSDVFRDVARPGDDPVMTTVSRESLGALLVSRAASRFVRRVPTLAVE